MKRLYVSLCALVLSFAFIREAPAQAHFLRGDANNDTSVNIADAIFTLGYLFLGSDTPPCLDAADTNDDGSTDIADPIYTLSALFSGGPPPAAPYPIFEADPTEDDLGCHVSDTNPMVDVTGDIASNQTWISTKVYRLVSGVFVKEGATLTIEAGTTVIGDKATTAVLVVERGAKLIAVGTETHPVVFTSSQPVGQRRKGDWGGVVLLGRGDINVAGKEPLAEGLPSSRYGGGANPDNDDSSGQLSYCRFEYGGVAISPDNEVNGISFFAVGRNTLADHIQTKFADDDSFEWFGGAGNLKYGIALGNTDDNIDYSFGYSGMIQFVAAIQNPGDTQGSGGGFEVDNSESPAGAFGDRPLTRPMVSNVTLIGTNNPGGSTGGQGILLRRGCGSIIYNGIIQGFRQAGFDIDDAITTEQISTGDLIVDHITFSQNGEDCQTGETGGQDESAAEFKDTSCNFIKVTMKNNIFSTTSPTVDPYTLTGPNLRPQNDALTNPFDPTTLDPFFSPAPYRGAVAPDGEDWTQAPWISYQQN
ncbi:MAG TPA: hypothetical protein VMT52_08965 [Planctomycetota bacterium]|nr:hypothetical protein [Planctomycetota bacterium]